MVCVWAGGEVAGKYTPILYSPYGPKSHSAGSEHKGNVLTLEVNTREIL